MKRLIHFLLFASFIVMASLASLAAYWFVRQERLADPANLPPLEISGVLPLPGEAFSERIIWYFNRPLASLAGADARDVLSITPALAGRVTAEGSHLIFRPADAPAPNTIYQVELGPHIRAADGAPIASGSRRFVFPTFAFEAESVWLLDRDAERATLAIRFPAAVDVAALQGVLAITDAGGKKITAEVSPGHEDRTYRLAIPGDSAPPFKIELAKGLADASGLVSLARPQTINFDPKIEPDTSAGASSRAPLAVEWSNARHHDREGLGVEFSLNWRVSVSELESHLSIIPPVANLRVEQKWGSSFVVNGDWASQTSYEIIIQPGLLSQSGQLLESPVSFNVRTSGPAPWLAFADKGQMFFPRRPDSTLVIESRNVTAVTVRISRLFPSNLPIALDDIRRGNTGRDFSNDWCEELGEKTIPLPAGRDRLHATAISLDNLLPAGREGVYFIHAENAGDNNQTSDVWSWEQKNSDAKIVLATNLGAIAHWTSNELILFAHNLKSLEPATSATVSIYSSKNQLLARESAASGPLLHFREFDSRLGEPKVVVIEQGGDFTFLDLEARSEDMDEISPAWPAYTAQPYDAFLYAERELIRPGETIHLRWIVSGSAGESAAGVPLLLRVLKPDGRPMIEAPETLSGFGTGGRDIETIKAHPTGAWRAQLLVPGSDAPIGEYQFHVEEFVPNRLKAQIDLVATQWHAGEKQRIEIHGEHLTGVPAAGRKAAAEVRLSAAPDFKFEQWPGFRFGNDDTSKPETIPLGESQLNAAGQASFTLDPAAATSERAQLTAPVAATIIGRVFELGGRAVSAKSEAVFFPSDICLGIAAAPAPEPGIIEVEAAAVASNGLAAEIGEVELTLERKTWRYHLRRYYSHDEPTWVDDYEEMETRRVPVRDGRARAAFAVEHWGNYRVRVHSPETPQFSAVAFYSSNGVCQVVDASRPALLRLNLDDAPVAVGGEARLRLEAPFDGRVLIILQNAAIREARLVEIVNQSAEILIPVSADFLPNVWIEATLIHALDREHGRAFPFSSFAKTLLRVENPARRINVEFAALPDEIAPDAPATFDVILRDAAGQPIEGEVTLAAVDEGIHAITNYKNPDPMAWLIRSRRPDLRRAHYYDRIAFDFEKPLSGGDGPREAGMGGDVASRLALDSPTWIAPVALWSGAVKTQSDGRASITLPIPDYTGRLRLVAVAASANCAMGAASGGVFVRRPFDLEIALPRFLLPGDSIQPLVQVRNFTNEPAKASLAWEFSGALEPNASAKILEIAPLGASTIAIPLAASDSAGAGVIRWTATIQDAAGATIYTIERDTPLPVHNPVTFESRPMFRALNPGEEMAISADDFVAAPEPRIHLTAGANPLQRLQGALTSLIAYPHGCVEQTTSRLMPMFVLRRHEALTRTALGVESAPLHEFLQAGIDRLFAMQTASGGLGYWPGASEDSEYGSVYALHFLTLAQNDPALQIPADNHKALKNYVRRIASESKGRAESDLYMRAYATFVIALDGDADAIHFIDSFEKLTLPEPARLMLAAALAAISPSSERVKRYLGGPSIPYNVNAPDAALASSARNKAVEFMALSKLPGTSAHELSIRASDLMLWLEWEQFASTQELAFVATALAGYLEPLAGNIGEAQAVVTFTDSQAVVNGADMLTENFTASAGPAIVKNTGQSPIFVNATISGVPRQTDSAPVAEGLELTRTIYNDHGEPVDPAAIEHGRSYVMALTLKTPSARRDLLIVDRLPAGFEIENTRLDPDLASGIKLPASADASMLELRDDRMIAAFAHLKAGTHHYSYVARAVTPGRFTQPPAQAECMYQPAIRARTAPAAVAVRADVVVTGPPVAEK